MVVSLICIIALVIGWKVLTAMAAGIAEIRASWETVGRIRSERMKLDAETAAVGNVVVPEGHALVSFETGQIQRVERSLDPNQTAVKAMDLKWKAFQWERRNEPPESAEKALVDLIAATVDPSIPYAICGAQRSGKSHCARWIASQWASIGREVIVLAPKWSGNEWGSCCTLYGPDPATILTGLRAVRTEAERRRETATRAGIDTESYPPVLVIAD
ncbi:MAG: hypothetical protein AAF353_15940, partial [Pseudomonadota bacterium]